ncbi:Vacuolar basic amino acid transporter 3 [Penicillium taxi]|uniref:Vacuolar basic amino acid transporter 3 n=1 Tax=Penicillium taxi TaxID=168475 RepID=UPI0025451BD7|nr:Vacuolar basic amino acid transporter 3 [Penicillium taxi]KAJ5893431.1 Vacuolar basic amino acid transporter 3 [Penicillium taxi]
MGSFTTAPFNVAIVGGGIAGVTVALGLLSRGIPVKLYERAGCFHEIGAGIGMSPNAERAMLSLDPRIHAVFRKLATPNTEDWFQYVDGFYNSQIGDGEDLLFKIYLGNRGFEGCRRSDFLAELAEMIPENCIEFQKEVISVTEAGYSDNEGGVTVLHFADGTVAEADIVLGCDGLRSKIRQLILGVDNPASPPSYSHKFAFRGLIPMQKAREALGQDKSSTRYMHLGHNGHVLTFPVAMGTILNVVAFVTDPGDWPSKERLTLPAIKEEAIRYFTGFGPVVTSIMEMLDDKLDKWGIFDLFDNPVPSYVSEGGLIGLVGDAAHASAPHHGAGAGCAIEDALALAVILEDAVAVLQNSSDGAQRKRVLQAVLSTYNDVRHERTQWLVQSSRFIGEMYEWQVPEINNDAIKGLAEAESRCRKIWDYDIDAMVKEARELFAAKI